MNKFRGCRWIRNALRRKPLGLAALAEGRFTDVLALDANYVRRSDAEIFWKGTAAHGH